MMKLQEVSLLIFVIFIVEISAAGNDDNLAECNEYLCLSGSVTRTDLHSSPNNFFRVNGEGPNATLSVLDGWDTFDTEKYLAVVWRYPGQEKTSYLDGNYGSFCFLPLVSDRKGAKYWLSSIVKTMLFPGYEGCQEKPKEYQVSKGFSGLFSFQGKVPSCDTFEILVYISKNSKSKDHEVEMTLTVVPDNALSCARPKGDLEPKPTGGPGGDVEAEPASGPGGETKPKPTIGSGGDVEAEPASGAGDEAKPEPEPTSEISGEPKPTADELAECNEYLCLSGLVTRTDLHSPPNDFFRVNGEGPNATLSVLDGWDTFDTEKYLAVEWRYPGQEKTSYLDGNYGSFCFLPLVGDRKGAKYWLSSIVKTMLFPGYEGCQEKPKEYQVSKGFSGLFSFQGKVPSCDTFEILVYISKNSKSKDHEVEMTLTVVPDNALSCARPKGDLEPKPTGGPGGDVEAEPPSGPGAETKPKPTIGSGGDVEAEPASGPGAETKPKPTIGSGGDVEAEPPSGPGAETKPKPTSGPGGDVNSEPASGPGSDAKPTPTSGPAI